MNTHTCRILFGAAATAWASASSGGAIEYRDALDLAVAPPDQTAARRLRSAPTG